VRDGWLAHQARDASERFQVIGAGALRGKQQKNQIDRLAIERLKIDGAIKSCEHAEEPIAELAILPCGDGDAIADSRRTQLFALQSKSRKFWAFVLAAQRGSARRKFMQRLLFVVDLKRRQNRVRCYEIVKRHGNDLE